MRSSKFFVSFLAAAAVCCVGRAETSIDVGTVVEKNEPFTDWNCVSTADCTTPNTTCVENRCQCKSHYVFNAPMTACLKAATSYGDECQETSQCTALLQAGGVCEGGSCVCSSGYHHLHGRCYKSSGLNEKCLSVNYCYAHADHAFFSCTNDLCACKAGHYQREYRTCRPKATEVGAPCAINQDCTFDKNARCNKVSGCYIKEDNSTNDFPMRQCKTVYRTKTERRSVRVLQQLCADNKECEVLGQAFCDSATHTCLCKPGYYADSSLLRCFPELGEPCGEGDESLIKNAVCHFGLWSCSGPTVPSKSNRLCLPAVTTYGDYCTFDEQCSVFGPDAVCSGSRCVCNEKSHYSSLDRFCWTSKKIGEKCRSDEDCYENTLAPQPVCNASSVCGCKDGNHVNAAGSGCVRDEARLGDFCSADVDCKNINNSVCYKNTSCLCAPHYFQNEDGECVKGIGAQCTVDEDCLARGSQCLRGSCQCKSGQVAVTTDLCMDTVGLNKFCEFDAQCTHDTIDAYCSGKRICECRKNQLAVDGRCKQIRKLADKCNHALDVCYNERYPESMWCNVDLCTCAKGYSPSYNWIECYSDKPDSSSRPQVSSLIGLTLILVKFVGVL